MEPDYLPIPEIFVSAVFVPQEDFIPQLDFTPHEDCTPFHDGGCEVGHPPRRWFGGNAPEAKNWVVFGTWFSAHCIVVPVLELAVSGV